MATEVAICNVALANLGDSAEVTSIAPPDGSAQAAHCAVFYPIARDAVISMHPWNFATWRSESNVALSAAPDTWGYVFDLPECAIFLGVYEAGDTQDRTPQDYAIEGAYIYTNVETPTFRYVQAVTDTTLFPPLVTLAISRYLSSLLAGPLIKGSEGMNVAKAQLQWFMQVDLPAARMADAKARKNEQYGEFIPDSIRARS